MRVLYQNWISLSGFFVLFVCILQNANIQVFFIIPTLNIYITIVGHCCQTQRVFFGLAFNRNECKAAYNLA